MMVSKVSDFIYAELKDKSGNPLIERIKCPNCGDQMFVQCVKVLTHNIRMYTCNKCPWVKDLSKPTK